jgi:hypothetical protein
MQFNLASGPEGAAAWSEWFTPYFDLIAARPEIKWFHYINYDWTQAGYYAATGWQNNDLALNPVLAGKYVAELSGARYLHAGELSLLNGMGGYLSPP